MNKSCQLCSNKDNELHLIAVTQINEGYLEVCRGCLNQYKSENNIKLLGI